MAWTVLINRHQDTADENKCNQQLFKGVRDISIFLTVIRKALEEIIAKDHFLLTVEIFFFKISVVKMFLLIPNEILMRHCVFQVLS